MTNLTLRTCKLCIRGQLVYNLCKLHGVHKVQLFSVRTVYKITRIHVYKWTTSCKNVSLGTRGCMYATSQTTVLHMERLSQTESPIFMILCVLCFQRQSFLTFRFGQQRLRSASMSTQSDQGLHCRLTESLDATECTIGEQRPGPSCSKHC